MQQYGSDGQAQFGSVAIVPDAFGSATSFNHVDLENAVKSAINPFTGARMRLPQGNGNSDIYVVVTDPTLTPSDSAWLPGTVGYNWSTDYNLNVLGMTVDSSTLNMIWVSTRQAGSYGYKSVPGRSIGTSRRRPPPTRWRSGSRPT